MLRDKRSGKIAFVAHCILNQNSRALGLAERSSVIIEILELLAHNDIGIVQLPCPELTHGGPCRQPKTKEQYDNALFRKHCRKIAEEFARHVKEYLRCGTKIKLVMGVDGSPSCGVTDSGILIEELESVLKEKEITIPFYGIRYERLSEDLANLEKMIRV